MENWLVWKKNVFFGVFDQSLGPRKVLNIKLQFNVGLWILVSWPFSSYRFFIPSCFSGPHVFTCFSWIVLLLRKLISCCMQVHYICWIFLDYFTSHYYQPWSVKWQIPSTVYIENIIEFVSNMMWVLLFDLLAMFQTIFSLAVRMKKWPFYKTRKSYFKLIGVIFWDRNHNSSQTTPNKRKQQILHLHHIKLFLSYQCFSFNAIFFFESQQFSDYVK